MPTIRRALLSVTDKTGLIDFARRLAMCGVSLVSTGGTAQVLREAGLEVRDVADVTGFPEMLDGRVKTLHPRIAGGILAVRSNPEHASALAEHEIAPIDMVVVNLYAFEATAAKDGATFDELIENIDIGGPALIRAAAKNFSDVAVVTDPSDYPGIADELATDGALSTETHWQLAKKAFEATAAYDRAIAGTLASLQPGQALQLAGKDDLPAHLDLRVPLKQSLRYGENPHQRAALYSAGRDGIGGARQLHGKELSYNNLIDLDASWQLAAELDRPAVAIIKHTNPCGCAEGATLANAYRKALACDPLSAFGSVIAVTREVDREAAEEMSKLFIEAIAAPGFAPDALRVLTRKKNLRLLEMGRSAPCPVLKSISGGYLVQSQDRADTSPDQFEVVSARPPTPSEADALRFAWKVVKHVKSNAILYARDGQTVGIGAGQMSRVDAARLGALKATLPLEGSVVASDAFFPFSDGVEELAKHGATAVIQPGGSRRDSEVIAAANRLGLAMICTRVRHFRH
jgi:phosphoribosylaminoimidazolecarboxamide formyltransferase/IMP cyclohydrolase